MCKLLVMIMSGGDYPTNDKYNKIEESIVNTWFQQKNDLVKIIIYKYEDVSEIIFDEEKRILKIPYGESLLGTGLDKTIRAFEWVSKNIKFDFLIRCNSGALIDIDEALRFIQTKQSKNLYCGHKIDKFNNGDQIVKKFDVQYVQGSCILFSKDVIQIFNRDDYFLDYCEDVSIGFYLMSKGITIDESNHRIDICDNQIYFTKNSVHSEQVEYYYHFRLRSSDRDFDIKSMKILWNNKTNGQFPIYINKNMEHFFQNIGEDWFTYPNLYKHVVDKFSNGSHFVEIGSWKGRSACYLGVEIVNSGKNIKFDCVDLWTVTEEELIESDLDLSLSKDDNLYKAFINNIQPLKDIINPIRNSSVNASSLYEDNSLDFVFIDAGHDYKSVKEDIEHWFNKVKTGGIIAGHDCYLPDVQKAVTEYFGNDIQISESCWIFLKK